MNDWKRLLRRTTAAAGLALLASCGGGSSPFPGGVSPEDAYDASRVLLMLLTGEGRWTVAGTGSDGATYEVEIEFDSDSSPFFPFPLTGELSRRSTFTLTLRRNGELLGTTEDITYIEPDSLEIRGTSSNDGTCSQVESFQTPPPGAQVGQSGALDSSTDYAACISGSPVTGQTDRSWSLEAESGTVFFCEHSTSKDTAGAFLGADTLCWQISRDGTLGDKARFTRTGPNGFSLSAAN